MARLFERLRTDHSSTRFFGELRRTDRRVPRPIGQTRVVLASLPFGSTGHTSSRLIFGAAALGSGSQDFADGIVEQVHSAGINHFDTAAGYGDSELRLAPWLAKHRGEVFLGTKTGERTGSGARAELERSLHRLGVDCIDLVQLHNLVEDEEWETAFGPDGAVAALDAARREGLVNHIGVTGHGLRIARMHLRSLEEYPFASVLFPFNHSLMTIDHYAADVEELRSVCRARRVAMQTIKSIAKRRWLPEGSPKFSWYEPLSDPDAIARAVRFVMSEPDLFVNTSSDARQLAAIVAAAQASDATLRPSDSELAADRAEQNMSPLFDGAALERI